MRRGCGNGYCNGNDVPSLNSGQGCLLLHLPLNPWKGGIYPPPLSELSALVCTILLSSAHQKSMVGPTQIFTLIKKKSSLYAV